MTRIERIGRWHWRRAGFRQQLTIAFCVGIMLAALTSSLVISLLSGQTIRDRFILEGHKAAETLALQSTLTLLYQSEENARDYAEAVLSAPDVQGVAIFDLTNKALLALGDVDLIRPDLETLPRNRPLTVETADSWYFTAPVYTSPASGQSFDSPFTVNPSTPELLGYAQVIMGKDTLHRVTGDIIVTNLFVSGVLAALLLAVLLFITGRVTRPINTLADTMRRGTTGERHIRAEIAGPRDVAEMQNAFNKMMEVLDGREEELKKARDAALESARIKGEFAATVSHELRTPLNGVLGMLELLQGMGLTPKQADYVQVARTSGESLLALVNDILDFSRNDSGEMATESGDFDLRTLLDEIVGLTGSEARRKGLELGFAINHDVSPALNGDVRRLQQVLLNLVGNAVKFSEHGEVSVTVEASEALDNGRFLLHFEVRDSGIGVPEQARTRIFEPFRQADGSTTRKYGGSGLGLAICKQIVEFAGGEIGIRSHPGAGSVFWFTFPFAATEHPVAGLFQIDRHLKGRRVLVADDSDCSRRLLRQTCESWGMLVRTCETLREMTGLLTPDSGSGAAPAFDLILVDEDMQGDYGRTAHDLLSTEPAFMRIPTLLLCSRNPVGYAHHPAIRGYVDKPVRTALLHKSVSQALRERPEQTPAQSSDQRASLAPARVLVVEDNRANQLVVAGMLERLGLLPTLASGGAEAIALIQERGFDLVLMDCNMPEMDGYQTTACIRALEEGERKIPIIAMTANVQEGDVAKCLGAGMDDYIAKPLNLAALGERLEGWLDRRADSAPRAAAEPARPAGPAPEFDREPTIDDDFYDDLKGTLGEAFSRMLGVFIEDLPGYLRGLDEAISEVAFERISGFAHTLKGSAANIGARRLAEICKRIEAAGRHQDIETARMLYAPAAAEADQLAFLLGERLSLDKPAPDGSTRSSGSYILVVDDDRATRVGLRNILEDEGYSVIEADDGTRAIDLCRQRQPELILMDAKMPVMDGFTACQYLKQQPESAEIPVLIITGLEDDDSIERAFAVGATDYISKPVNFSVLRRRIAHLMNASKAERDMKRLAYTDPLTGLPNRVLFTNHLNQLLKLKQESSEPLAVMFVDVDRFKLINDTLGHDAGDMLLKIVAERLSNCVRDNDLVARLGGDEFTIVIDNVGSREVLSAIARKICQSFSRPVVFLDREIFITLSIGISVFPSDAGDLAGLMKHADTAMFHAKRYRNDFCFFESVMEADVSRRLELENDLRRAIERNELVVYYQPQADAATSRIVGMEALVRWRHPERGLVPPLEFISLAEDIGLIDAIGDIVLHESCRQLRAWLDRGYGPLRLAVNMSGRQLEKPEIVEMVSNTLISTQVPSQHLELEITESVVMENALDMIEVFGKFKAMGIHLAIDDFGTGYSSLAYLKRFPVDTIKIDRSFVRDVPADAEDVAIVTGVVAMAKGLGLKVVAEGVETPAQLEFLSERGCDYVQGYLLSEPLPAEEFERRFLAPELARRAPGEDKIALFKGRSR